MRKDDRGYATRVFPAIITVDGTVVRKCYTADEELGEAWCYVTNEAGVVQRAANGGISEICIRGKVVITPCGHR